MGNRLRLLVSGLCLAVLGTMLPAVATAAATPSDVAVAWADPTHEWVRITWHDDGAANVMRLSNGIGQTISASTQNILILNRRYFFNEQFQVSIYEQGPDGRATGSPGQTPWLRLSDLTESSSPVQDPAPTNVTVGWYDDTHQQVRISWTDDGLPNIVSLFQSNTTGDWIRLVPASAANELVVDTRRLRASLGASPEARIGVQATAPGGMTATSAAGYSVYFDRTTKPSLLVDGAHWESGRLRVDWHLVPRPEVYPGDPLDLPYQPDGLTATVASRQGIETFRLPVGTTTWLVPDRGRPVDVDIVPDFNEWGRPALDDEQGAAAGDYDVHASVPTAAVYGRPTVVTGTVTREYVSHTNQQIWHDPIATTVVLQYRNRSTDPWRVVNTARTSADGRYRFSVGSPGTRQLRVVAPNATLRATDDDRFWDTKDLFLTFGRTTMPATSTTSYAVRSAGFADNTVALGQPATIRIGIAPAVNVRATLQRWTGSAWTDVKWVYLRNGLGSYTFTAAKRGATGYRYVVPASTHAGRTIASVSTGSLVLSIR